MNSPIKIWRETKKRYQHFGKIGRLISFTKVRQGPTGFEKNSPYWIGIIRFRNGQKVTGQVVGADEEEVKIGARVKGVLRILSKGGKRGVIEYGVKFKVI